MNGFKAQWYDGKSARSRPVDVHVLPDSGLRVRYAATERRYAFADIKVDEPIGNFAAVVDLPDGGRLEIPNAEGFHIAMQSTRGGGSRVHALESRWSLVLVVLGLALVIVWAGISFGVPAASKTVAQWVPRHLDVKLGEQGLQMLDRVVLAPTQLDDARRAELNAVFAQVIDTVGADGDYRLEFRAGEGVGANALALPSGIVVLTDELVQLAAADVEIAAVLAHEVGHVRERHTLRSVIQNSALAAVLVMVTGDVGTVANLAAGIPALLVERSYSREFEREADTVAFDYLNALDIPGQPMADLLTRIDAAAGDSELPSLLDTHPRAGERVR